MTGSLHHLQRTVGNAVVQRLLVQAKQDHGERPAPMDVEGAVDRSRGSGQALDGRLRGEMERAFGTDFGGVRIHTDARADRLSRSVGAQAFTTGRDIFFREGRYDPGSTAGRRLLAHELTHVVQQTGGRDIYFDAGRRPGNDAVTAHELVHVLQQTGEPGHGAERVDHNDVPGLQRIIELRPPGPGEASAFDRRQELIDRLNALSPAIQYRLEAAPVAPRERIAFDVRDEAALTDFDHQMRAFIGRAEVVPLRLITGAGRVLNAAGGFDPLLFDSFIVGYLDLDDLLASDDHALSLVLLHLLAERFSVPNYARRIGTNLGPAFEGAHRAGRAAETQFLRDLIGDPTIRFNYEETRPNGTLVVAWRSDEDYRVFHIIRRAAAEVRGGEVSVQTPDGRRLSVEDFIAERAAPAP